MRRVAAAIGALLTLTGCAADKPFSKTTVSTSVENRPGQARSSATTAPSGTRPSAVGGTPRTYSASQPPAAGYRPADTSSPGPFPLELSITPSCVEHGQTLTISAKSNPKTPIDERIMFPNGVMNNLAGHKGTTNSQGLDVWKVEVTSAAKEGQGSLFASAEDPAGKSTGTSGTWKFIVAAPGGCAG